MYKSVSGGLFHEIKQNISHFSLLLIKRNIVFLVIHETQSLTRRSKHVNNLIGMNMNKTIIRPLFSSAVFIAILFSGFACSTSDDYLDEFEVRRMIEEALRENNENLEFTQWDIVNITVNQNDWEWNNEAAQWEAVYDLPELTEFIYEQGAQLGYVFIGEQGVDEVQKLLPYVDTWYAGDDTNGDPVYFTETISVDFQLGNPSTVAFFIKDSQLAQDPDAPRTYNFRIVLIW
jgi:hypothetical protein